MQLDRNICQQARLSKDRRFDGKFYTAVITTGIYCRPTCPAGPALEQNVRYFHTAVQAEVNGFNACKRCRPELAPNQPLPSHIEQAIELLRVQPNLTVAQLAKTMSLSERQLQRLFEQNLSVSPKQFINHQRLITARTLLLHTGLAISDIATIAGFGSLRSFNDNVKQHYQLSPTQVRKQGKASGNDVYSIKLAYQGQYNWPLMLNFFKARIIPGVELIDDAYHRTLQLFDDHEQRVCHGWFKVSFHDQDYLQVDLQLSDYQYLGQVLKRIRVMFDLDCDIDTVNEHLGQDRQLAQVISDCPGLRLPGCFDVFEFSIRAILGQQITVKAATTLASRINERYGQAFTASESSPTGLSHYFPSPTALADAEFNDMGITTTRMATLQRWVSFYRDNKRLFVAPQSAEQLERQLCELKGIGPWTANYLAMRGLSMNDAFPAADLGIIKALGGELKPKQILQKAEAWRPWRAYAAIYLWHSLAH
ncbi:DNA-3-methyladenine glycosylase 2 family protein [Thalassotalea sp. HSM 43]|uniref:DNA-3-methyladenine glycosylase 2 n=1 Tax=Thalassotalea sp. HSM 43 TaxID=2552945 RepID=UPI001081F27D|nr:DNA-3-methyladenine glycosylase 2 [Thalassotalea sp. HSM 43]QBY05342.1 DNA-3-methyladenine glycosylase 2 family protein [Thalassotalea sp. HSM 43]